MRKSAFPLCGKALFKQWVRLSLSLIVGDALRLGGVGAFGCECQHDQGNDVRQHIVHSAGNVQRLQEGKAGIDIAQRPEEAEQQRRQRDPGR